jgi:hypothetical protein
MRKFSWVILAINALFLIWIIAAVAGSDANCGPELSAQACQDATAIGTGLGVAVIIFLWAMVDVILGVVWLVTRKKEVPA